jgi:hypothetical protein
MFAGHGAASMLKEVSTANIHFKWGLHSGGIRSHV